MLLEYTYTKNQSDPVINPKTGKRWFVSGDSYFSHSQYKSGFTYKALLMGTSLFGPVKFTKEGVPNGSENTRLSAIDAGVSGELFPRFDYKLMATWSQNYGRNSAEYKTVRNQFFSLASFTYTFQKIETLYVETQFAFDSGSLWSGEQTQQAGFALKLGYIF